MPATIVEPHKSSIGGLDANIMALLAYLGTGILMLIPVISYVAWLAPLVVFLIEKQSGFVRFHAMQAFILNIVNFVLVTLLGGIIIASITAAYTRALQSGNFGASLGGVAFVSALIWIITVIISIFAIIAMFNAFKYKLYKIPVIGGLAAQFSGQSV